MVKTYREVLRNIRPGETWECIGDCNMKSISYIDEKIRIEFHEIITCNVLDDDTLFKLKKDEVEFEDAVKALKEGKTIESCVTASLYKIKRRCMDDTILTSKQNSPSWLDLDCNFKTKEVLGKWCIYEEGEI